ncbi:MAG TPA: DUF885 domain-containing protein [Blastocatellia bacterium]|nr:DUF885 domain-containing protein [Blastocatellia bacterium]
MIRNIAVLTTILMLATTLLGQVASPGEDSSKLHALFEEDWEWRLREFPEAATYYGDRRYNDRLTDRSPEAIERRKAHDREMLERIRKIDRSKLSGQDLVSYDLYLEDKKQDVEGHRFPFEVMPVNQMGGIQIDFPQLVSSSPFRNAKDYENYLARLAAFPKAIDQVIALMRRGIETKWVFPAVPLRSVPSQIEGQIVADATKSPIYQPFESFPSEVPEADRARLAEAGRRSISENVMPALKKLLAFFRDSYLPAAPSDISASSLPDGPAYYAYMARTMTTTSLTPKEIHEIGKKEVARIRQEMEAIIRQVGFKGSFQDFLTFLRTDERFYYKKAEDLVTGYRDIAKRADGKLPELFAELPRNTYGVREIPGYEAPAQTTAYYLQGATDGSRAGTYWVNTYKLETRPKYEMEALSLHESVPGHHLQIARAQELKGLPDFRRNGSYTAYVEGWALYAESLGAEMGFYTDPYSRFGQLTYEMWRAVRLVVDTGMHSLGWTRQQAIDLMKENTAKTENDIVVEIDRYIVWPGQALAYKLGELKIKELRAKARRELGDQFDIRRFHNAVLDDGPLPLGLLEKRIDLWISGQKGKN